MNILYHGSCYGKEILNTKCLYPMSFPEYDLDIDTSVLSLSRSYEFSRNYALQIRDDNDPLQIVVHIDRNILNYSHKLYLGRSTIFDNTSYEINRSECEEFVLNKIPLDHPSIILIEEIHG